MIEPLTYLINKSFTDCIILRELRFARIVPILKAGDQTQIKITDPYQCSLFSQKSLENHIYIALFWSSWMPIMFSMIISMALDGNTRNNRL